MGASREGVHYTEQGCGGQAKGRLKALMSYHLTLLTSLKIHFQTAFRCPQCLRQPSVTISICCRLRPKKRSPMVWKRSGMSLT